MKHLKIFLRASMPNETSPYASLPGASLQTASLSGQRCQIPTSLLHGWWKLLGELFGTGAHDPDALDVVIVGYEIIGLQISKHFQPERVLKAWFR